ncbi:hemoblobin-interacting domain-containing protein [Stomatobaculum longum]|uniref:hemoblobin-interacting domain-containing protein n=1 Tax=Stomatobaculum longum TaxID=796942 RepID=UPI0028EAEE2C|nr:hemoblobin-interacting domain-containing protein [Stomatobaculum longum]
MRKYGLKALAIATAMSMVLSSPLQVYAKRRANTAGSWKQSGENWSFLDEKGQNVLGWIYENGSWYYVDPKTGTLRSGWLYLADGSQYFFSNKHDGSFSKMLTGWNWIDGNCYYFVTEADEREGKLIKDGTTPDGYRVDKDGKWVDASGNIQSRTGEGYITKSANAGKGGSGSGKSGGTSSSGKRGGSGGGGSRGGRRGGGSHTTPVKPVQPEEQSKPVQPEAQPASPSNPAQPGVITPENPTNPANPAVSPEAPEHPVGPVEDDRPGKNGDASKPENKQPEKELKSRMVHLGFADFVTVVFRQGTLADHEIYVDGVNVTEAVRKVDDAGRVVKWASTVASPKELVVVNKADGSTEQTLRLNAGTASETVTPGNPEDQPDYILSRGRVSKFDYLLAPKDKEGRDRILPATTTFDLLQERKENSDAVTTQFYVKAVEIDGVGKGVQKDNIVIKFNVENEEQKKWFEGIDSLKIMNNENWPVNQNPTFTKEVKDTKHGKNGIIQIPTGQDNMRSRGIYRVNIHSSYTNETVTVPFELVSSAKFGLKQRVETANPKAGERVQFNVEASGGESFGNDLKIDSMRVTLKKPSGKVVELKYIDDFFNFGDLFVLYGKSSNEEKTVNTDEVGVYTLTLKYSGYQTIKKKFEVYPGQSFLKEEDSETELKAKKSARSKPVEIDAVSSATTGSVSGKKSSGSSGGGQYVDGRMVFDYDLLTNALILNEIEALNEDARAVVKRFFDTTESDYIYKDGAEKLYRFTDYMDAYKEARLAGGKSLSFKEYTDSHAAASYAGPNEVQNVLEDGSLGALTSFKFYQGDKVPDFSGTTAVAGNDFVLRTDDSAYLEAIRGLYVDGESRNLMDAYEKQYVLDKAAGTLTVKRGAFNFYNTPEVGEHKLKIDAGQKYRAAELKLTYTAAEALPTLALQGEAKQNADVTVNVEGLSAERLAAKLAKVELSNSEESGLRRLMTATEGGTSSDDYYELSGTQLILKGGLFKTTGNYSLYLKFTDAKIPVKVDFTVAAAEATPEQPTVEEKAAPTSATLEKEESLLSSNWLLRFEGLSADELESYLSKITELSVNGTAYERKSYSYGLGNSEYGFHKDSYGRNDGLKFAIGALAAGENRIVVKAEGYAEKEFAVQNGSAAPAETAKKKAPTAAQAEKVTPRQGYDSGTKEVYDLTFTGLDADALDTYLRAKITKLTVNGKRYTEAQSKSYLFSMDDKYATLFDRTYKKNGVRLSANGFTEASNEVVLEVEGYEPFRFTVERASAEESENEATAGKAVPTGAVLEKVIPRQGYDIGSKPAYALSFEGLEDEALDTWLRSDDLEVSVNGKNLSSVHANYIHLYDDRFAFSLKRYRRAGLTLSGNLFESGSNEVTVKAGGYQVGSFTLTVE